MARYWSVNVVVYVMFLAATLDCTGTSESKAIPKKRTFLEKLNNIVSLADRGFRSAGSNMKTLYGNFDLIGALATDKLHSSVRRLELLEDRRKPVATTPQPDVTTPQPDVPMPQRDVTTPQPEVTTPQADVTTTQPEVMTPQPDVTTPQPDVTTPQPEVTTPQPDVTTPQPDVTTPQQEVTTPQPDVTTPQPDVTTPQPDVTTPQPEVTTPPPDVTTPQPDVTMPQPDVTTPQPEVTAPQPDVTTPQPDVTMTPRVTTPHAVVTTTKTEECGDWRTKNGTSFFSFCTCTQKCSVNSTRNRCREKQAELAKCNSRELENFFVLSLNTPDYILLGGNDRVEEGTWRWPDGSLPNASYTNWASGQPDGGTRINCLMWLVPAGKWYDVFCDDRFPANATGFVCEKKHM